MAGKGRRKTGANAHLTPTGVAGITSARKVGFKLPIRRGEQARKNGFRAGQLSALGNRRVKVTLPKAPWETD